MWFDQTWRHHFLSPPSRSTSLHPSRRLTVLRSLPAPIIVRRAPCSERGGIPTPSLGPSHTEFRAAQWNEDTDTLPSLPFHLTPSFRLNLIQRALLAWETYVYIAKAGDIQLKSEVYIHLAWSHSNSFFNHSTNFLITNYSFSKSVRTSTLCMTSNCSNNCLQTDIFTYFTVSQFQWVRSLHTLSWLCL